MTARTSAIIWKATCSRCGKAPLVTMPSEPRFCIVCGAPNPTVEAIGVDHDPAFWHRVPENPQISKPHVRLPPEKEGP